MTAVFMENHCKKHLHFYGLVTEIKNNLKKITAVFTKNRCKMVFYSGCYIRTTVNILQRFLTKPLFNFAVLPITAVVQPLLTGGNNCCKSPFVVQ
jgi:hypothetical protein